MLTIWMNPDLGRMMLRLIILKMMRHPNKGGGANGGVPHDDCDEGQIKAKAI